MKSLARIGVAFGAIALILSLYLQFVIVVAADEAEASRNFAMNNPGSTYFGSSQHMFDMTAIERKVDFGIMVLGAGLLAFLVSIIPAIKKQNIAWLGVALGIIASLLGAAYGTHLFS